MRITNYTIGHVCISSWTRLYCPVAEAPIQFQTVYRRCFDITRSVIQPRGSKVPGQTAKPPDGRRFFRRVYLPVSWVDLPSH